MTENEAKVFIQNAMEQSKNVLAELMLIMPKVFAAKRKSLGEYYSNLENCKKEIQSCEVAIKALEDVQQYRALEKRITDMFGGELSLEDVTDELERYLKEPDNAHPINAKILTYEDAAAWDAYRAIGTPEECRVAMEKQTAKRPDYEGDGYADGHLVYDTWICPCCGKHYEVDYDEYDFCPDCGQKLDWEGERWED